MKHFLASFVLLFWAQALLLAQAQDPPATQESPQTQPATQPADPPPLIFKLGGAPPKDDGRPKFPTPQPPKETVKPKIDPPVVPTPEKPADLPKPDTQPAKREEPKPIAQITPKPLDPPATQPATMPNPVGPFKLGDSNVNLPKNPDPVAATKPADTKPVTRKPGEKEPPLVMKDIPFAQPDFPPGLFSDGNFYRLADLRGKAVVLFFFDSNDDRVLATIPQRNALVKKFHDKPVVFFGVENDTINNVQRSARALNLQMPVFADTLGVMMARYHVRLSASSTWNVCIINGAGKASHEEMTEAAIEKAIQTAKWHYREQFPIDPRLAPAVDALELGDYERGMKLVSMWSNHIDRRVSDPAKTLLATLRAEAETWKTEADVLAPTETMRAYDLYARIMLTCPGTDIAKAVADPLKKLANHREVKPEIAARGMYKVLCNAVSRDEGIEKWDAVGYCEEIIRVAPGTQTADRLIKYLDDLGKVRERGVYGPRQYRRATSANIIRNRY